MVAFLLPAVGLADPPSQVGSVATQVVTGRYWSCGLGTDGSVACWGLDDHGQLGADAAAPQVSARPLHVLLPLPAVAISAGAAHGCALLSDGTVSCWGANNAGQLGDGTRQDRSTPQPVGGLTHIARVVNGAFHSCALDSAGAVTCWGANESGQLGNGQTAASPTPVAVAGLDHGVLALAAGGRHTCALRVSGAMVCWGDNASGQLGNATMLSSSVPVAVGGVAESIVALSAGDAHTCAIGNSGNAYCWGHNGNGQLGNGTLTGASAPVAVALAPGAKAVSIAAGFAHTCAVLRSDEIDCWGDDDDGELGSGSTSEHVLPTPVAAANALFAGATVSAGYSHTCATTPTGGVVCWGSNGDGELGNGFFASSSRPGAVIGHAGAVVAVSGNYQHFCSVTDDGSVQCWGANHVGELGSGAAGGGAVANSPQAVPGLAGAASAVATGALHSCALLRDGRVQCWGFNSDGQLGNGVNANSAAPVTVVGLLAPAVAITAGESFTCAVLGDGRTMCWGNNDYGQLGNGGKQASNVPVLVGGLSGPARAASAGDTHACAVLTNQTVMCWGGNISGQLGVGNTTDRSTATAVVGLSGPVAAVRSAIAANTSATCAAMADGSVQCWGSDKNLGQLGQGTIDSRVLGPSTVANLGDAAAVYKGSAYFCATQRGGGASCWGDGINGQLGNGQRSAVGTPAPVQNLSGAVVEMAGSYQATCAIRSAGDLYCWGDNNSGQLGLGYTGGDASVAPSSVLLGQRLRFDGPGPLTVGAPALSLSGTASSGLAPSFDSWTPATCQVVQGAVVANHAGVCGLRASQTGNGAYASAPQQLVVVPVTGVPQFGVTKSADVASAIVGQRITYTIQLTNTGTDEGTATLSDDLPAAVGYSDASPISCTLSPCDLLVQCVPDCRITGSVTLPAGGTATITVKVFARSVGDATNTVTLTPTSAICQTSPCGGGTASTGAVVVGLAPQFTLNKQVDQTTHVFGDTVLYALQFANTGSVAGTAQWQDTLPATLTLTNISCSPLGAGATCDSQGSSGNALQGSIALPPGGQVQYTITATATAVGDATNTVHLVPTTAGCFLSADGSAGNCGGGSASTQAATIGGARLSMNAALGSLGRIAPSDQFLLNIGGPSGDQVVTGGSGAAIVSRAVGVVANAGTQFSLSETMASGSASTLDQYAPQLTCTNARAVADGGTDPATLKLGAIVTLRLGDNIDCLVLNGGAAATLTVHQSLVPMDDGGKFTFALNGSNSPSLGNGASWGPVSLPAGAHTLTQSGAGSTVLGQYAVAYACVDADTRVAVASGNGASAAVNLAPGQHLDCTFTDTFAHSRLAGSVTSGRSYAQFGHVVTYLVQVANRGGVDAGLVHVDGALAPELDPASVSFICVPLPPATCTASAARALADTPTLPAGASVTYLVTATVLKSPATDRVDDAVGLSAANDVGSAQVLHAGTQLVIFRDSYEPGADGSQWNGAGGSAQSPLAADAHVDVSALFTALPERTLTTVAHVSGLTPPAHAQLEAVRIGAALYARFVVAASDDVEHASDWLALDAKQPLAVLGWGDGVLVLASGANTDIAASLPAGSQPDGLQIVH